MASTLGSRIREAREARGVSSCVMAARLGRTPEGVALYEEGALVPSGPVLALIARVLDIPYSQLVDDSVRDLDRRIADQLGPGPIVAPHRRAAMTTLLAPKGGPPVAQRNPAVRGRPGAA